MHLLCGLDESAPGRNAAFVAGAVARRLDAELTLLHVAEGAVPAAERRADACGVPVRLRVEPAHAPVALFGALANDVAVRTGARVDLRIDAGEPTARLLSAVEELDADLLVIGHTRRGRLADMLVGEVHDRVMSDATVPVMLVPAGASVPAPRRIVLACRRSSEPPRAAELAGRLAARMDSSVVVTQVVAEGPRDKRPTGWEVYDAARRDAAAAAVAAGELDVEYAEYEGAAGATLAAVPDELGAALLVIGQRRRPRWQRLLRPSVAADVARRAQQPVIVVPDPHPRPARAPEGRGGRPSRRRRAQQATPAG